MNVCASRNLRILFITGGSPWPIQLGVNQRTNLLLRALRQCGDVDTVINSYYAEFSDQEMDTLRENYGVIARLKPQDPSEQWPWRLVRPLSARLASGAAVHLAGPRLVYQAQVRLHQWLAARLRECQYDLIVGRYLRALTCTGALAYRPVILDLDDFDCSTQRSRLQQPGLSLLHRLSVRRQASQLEKIMPRLLGGCDHIWVASREDQELLRVFPTSILPNIPFEGDGVKEAPPCPPRPESKSILMIGSLRHTVNVNAIERFLTVVWPRVYARVPGSEFRIVGFGMTEEQKCRWRTMAGVVPVGFVQEADEEYDRSAFTVVPIFEGGGTKIKVLESLRYGRTLVATSHSCRGYQDVLQHLDSVWIAPDEAALAEGCIRLLAEPALRARMADRGCHLVRQHFSYGKFQQEVRETVDRVAVDGGVRSRR